MKSQNGWQASQNRDAINVRNYLIAGTKRHFACNEIAAPILCAFIAEFHELIEKIDEGTWDDWGYCYRDVRGINGTLSNHSSGTAVDIDSKKHPMGKARTFAPPAVEIIQNLCKKYGIVWGGNFTRKDEMHFEIIETPAQVIERTKSMKLPMPKVRK
jgi:hypothetical protein